MIELRFQNFFAARNKIVHPRRAIFGPFEQTLKSKKIRIDFFKMSEVLTPTIINEKTQLGKVVSLLEGLECHFHAEHEKSIFYLQSCAILPFPM